MIWIALGIMLLMGGAATPLTDQLKQDHKRAKTVLEGTPQRDAALDLLESMRKLSQKSTKESRSAAKRGLKQGRDHSRPSSEVAQVMEPDVRRIADIDREFLDARERLRTLLTREQWDAVFGDSTTAR